MTMVLHVGVRHTLRVVEANREFPRHIQMIPFNKSQASTAVLQGFRSTFTFISDSCGEYPTVPKHG